MQLQVENKERVVPNAFFFGTTKAVLQLGFPKYFQSVKMEMLTREYCCNDVDIMIRVCACMCVYSLNIFIGTFPQGLYVSITFLFHQ